MYIDFDNVVISRYDNLHGDGAWRKDEARHHRPDLDLGRPGRRQARPGRGRPRRDHRLRRVVRGRRDDPGVRRLVGARERRVQEGARRPGRRPGPAVRRGRHQERRRHPARRRRRRGPVQPPRHHPRHPRRRRLRLRAARPALQADGPVRRRHRRRRLDQPGAGQRLRRVPELRGPARSEPTAAPAALRGRQEGHRDGSQVLGEEVRGQEDQHAGAGRARRAGRVRRAGRADRRDGPAGPRGPGRACRRATTSGCTARA